MKIRDFYPSNIVKKLRKRLLLSKSMMRYAYITLYPRQYEMYRLICNHFNGDEGKIKKYIKEYGFSDPRMICVPNVEYIINESRLGDDLSYILEDRSIQKK